MVDDVSVDSEILVMTSLNLKYTDPVFQWCLEVCKVQGVRLCVHYKQGRIQRGWGRAWVPPTITRLMDTPRVPFNFFFVMVDKIEVVKGLLIAF